MKQPFSKQGVPFTQVANALLNDAKLSWKAKGLFAYLYSKPEKWDFSTQRMYKDSAGGRESLMSGIKELEDAGYLTRKRLSTGKVTYFMTYEPKSGNPTVEKLHNGETRPVSNIVLDSKKEESNKERGETSSPDFGVSKILSKEKYSPYLGSPMDYFRDEAKRLHRLPYLEYEEDRSPRIKKQIKSAVSILGKEIRPFIDWWFDGAGERCFYEPEACFTNRMYTRYENREVIALMQKKARGRGVRMI